MKNQYGRYLELHFCMAVYIKFICIKLRYVCEFYFLIKYFIMEEGWAVTTRYVTDKQGSCMRFFLIAILA